MEMENKGDLCAGCDLVHPPDVGPGDHSKEGREVRYTDPKTGGQKGMKGAQLGALDPLALQRVAEVAGYGASKYARLNYMKGYPWSLCYDALQRHLMAFWGGEYLDKESGLPHLSHACWHALALISFHERSLGTDDRPPAIP